MRRRTRVRFPPPPPPLLSREPRSVTDRGSRASCAYERASLPQQAPWRPAAGRCVRSDSAGSDVRHLTGSFGLSFRRRWRGGRPAADLLPGRRRDMNFGRAAEQLHIAQPSLSQAIGTLERELGVPLFHRVGRGIVLTDAGAQLIEPARQVLRDLESAQAAVQSARGLQRGRVELVAMPSPGIEPLTTMMRDFAAAHPAMSVSVDRRLHPRRGGPRGQVRPGPRSGCSARPPAEHRWAAGAPDRGPAAGARSRRARTTPPPGRRPSPPSGCPRRSWRGCG